MKEGDRIVCIKDYYCEGPITLGLLFCKGTEYKIHKIELTRNRNGVEITVLNNINAVYGTGGSFYEWNLLTPVSDRLFSDYFITIKDQRKFKLLKLEKINGSQG